MQTWLEPQLTANASQQHRLTLPILTQPASPGQRPGSARNTLPPSQRHPPASAILIVSSGRASAEMSAGRPSITARACVPEPPNERRKRTVRPVASSYSFTNILVMRPYASNTCTLVAVTAERPS